MTSIVKSLVIVIVIGMVAIFLGGCSSSSVPQGEAGTSSLPSSSPYHVPVNGLVQHNTGGKVSIDIEWLGTVNGLLTFAVAMNTHSVDLDRYDLGKLAVLHDDTGKEYRPITWDSAPGGHHRRGTLTFPIPDSLSREEAEYVQLVIRDVANVKDRTLTWELK